MGLRNALKWTIVYRGITVGSLVLGLALVGAGLLAGFGTSVTSLVTEPRNVESAIEQANPVITLALTAVGVVVWQLGKTYALFVTLPRAAGRAAGRQVDASRLASEVQDALDDRLSDLEADVAETRRAVRALEGDEHTATFDERDRLDGETGATADDAPSELEPAISADAEPSPPSSPSDGPTDAGIAGEGSAESADSDADGGDTDGDGTDPLA